MRKLRKKAFHVMIKFGLILALISNAVANDAKEKYNLGTIYLHGNGVDVDLAKACDLFEESANSGFELAQYGIGNCYFHGEGRNRDLDKAITWYKLAASQGSLKAYGTLGAIFLLDDTETNNQYAIELLRKASARKRLTQASFLMGYVCLSGMDTSCDMDDGINYLVDAAKFGNTLSFIMLSCVYKLGAYEISVDIGKSNYWRDNFEKVNQFVLDPGLTFKSGVDYLYEKKLIDLRDGMCI